MGSALISTIIRFLVLLSMKCENGGISNGATCTCPEFTYGADCQNIKDIIEIGKYFDVTMKVELTLNYTYTSNLNNTSSEEYKEFIKVYNDMLKSLFDRPNGNITVLVLSTDNGYVKVRNNVTLTLQYINTRNVLEQYEENYNDVKAVIENNKCTSRTLCIKSSSTEAILPLSEHERCGEKISPRFIQFFDPVVSEGSLACMSKCLPSSPNYLNCSSGSCQIKDEEGPQCFCPRTDLYIYINARCEGAILIAALYGGVGAAIGVLVIIGVVLGVFLYRKKYYY
ncbi:mucin-3B-like isoform X2 [Bufo gargarizans]|uniref:mucin-3B-like isoform X2 n=1 Tax=Bufo gargarizans TaxID=30331 RepID=UPI001CF459AF|nr:mucin-3B-like isoform X2 [Bufo gargarizans]